MKKRLHTIKKYDFIILGISSIVIIFSCIFSFQKSTSKSYVIIQQEKNKWIYPLDKEQFLEISGILGITQIQIKENSVIFIDSPCENKTCVASTAISKNGEWIACLPNNVIAYIEANSAEDETDITSF